MMKLLNIFIQALIIGIGLALILYTIVEHSSKSVAREMVGQLVNKYNLDCVIREK